MIYRGYVITDGTRYVIGFTQTCQLFENFRRVASNWAMHALVEASSSDNIIGYMLYHGDEERGLLYKSQDEAQTVLEKFGRDEVLGPRCYKLMCLTIGEKIGA